MTFLRKIDNFLGIDWQLITVLLFIALIMSISFESLAVDINGEDLSGDMETIGSLFKTADAITFGWVSPFAAGIFVIIASVGLVRSHFMLFATCMLAAMLILLVPKIVGEIKKKGGESVLTSEYVEYVRSADHV